MPSTTRLEILRLAEGSDLTAVRFLIHGLRDHLIGLGVPIESFQSLSEEIGSLPGKYSETSRGCLLVARLVPTTAEDAEARRVNNSLPLPRVYSSDELCLPPSDEEAREPTKPVVVGCVAFKDISSSDLINTCEMKRLFVLPSARGNKSHRIGEQLCRTLISIAGAEQHGYSCMKLDSLDRLPEACRLYETKLGFSACEPYVFNPMPDARYYSMQLKGEKDEETAKAGGNGSGAGAI